MHGHGTTPAHHLCRPGQHRLPAGLPVCRCSAVLLLLAFILSGPAAILAESIQSLDQKSYFPAVLQAIASSKASIVLAMPLIHQEKKDGPVSQVLDALARARKRGVSVRVFLDLDSAQDVIPGGRLNEAYEFFKASTIDVFFDQPTMHLNNRVIIIDETLVIGGSAALTDSLPGSMEACFRIESPALAGSLLDEIESISTTSDPLEEKNENFALVPLSFFSKNGALVKMVARNDEEALDVYLGLVRDFDGNRVNTDNQKIADSMRLSRRIKPEQLRSKISSSLKKLEKTYGVIRVSQGRKSGVTIRVVQNPGETAVWFPRSYWTWRWHKELPLHAKAFLLINLKEISFKRNLFSWKSSRLGIVDAYGISYWAVDSGMQELLRENIIGLTSVEHDPGDEKLDIIQFHYSGFYDKDEFYKSLQALASKHDSRLVEKAKNYAAILYKKFDIPTIEHIVSLLETRDEEQIKNVFDLIIRSKAVSNERRPEYLRQMFREKK